MHSIIIYMEAYPSQIVNNKSDEYISPFFFASLFKCIFGLMKSIDCCKHKNLTLTQIILQNICFRTSYNAYVVGFVSKINLLLLNKKNRLVCFASSFGSVVLSQKNLPCHILSFHILESHRSFAEIA